jgi:hypothetical protein
VFLHASHWLLSKENEPVLADARDAWGLIFVGILIIALWLGFRKIKGLADEPTSED